MHNKKIHVKYFSRNCKLKMPAETFFEKCSKFNKLKHYDSKCKLRSTKKREKNEKEQVNVRHFSFLLSKIMD